MKTFFPPKRNFKSLSVPDLLAARECYHVHLSHLNNVVGTAIGLYRIRTDDADAQKFLDPNELSIQHSLPRTLSNSIVKPWSWPCILVFVNEWVPRDRQDPDQVIPRFLYMPDGKLVPTCVIYVERQERTNPPLASLGFPSELVGGGYPVITDDQGQEHIGSIGCLVHDGDLIYGLTNMHVTGTAGRPIFTIMNGKRVRLGQSDAKQVSKKPFQEVYRGWNGSRVLSNLDVGLIRIDDLRFWTAQVFGIGEVDTPIDLNTDTISLDLIGCPVKAFGAASGPLSGEIQALFYRYKSIGGMDYTSDLLIGPRLDETMNTMPGDSGTVWFFDNEKTVTEAKDEGKAGFKARRYHPIAIQWGGQSILVDSSKTTMNYALATCLSTVCCELDVEVVTDWNIGHNEYWGKLGHYKLGVKACDLISDPLLQALMKVNAGAIGFDDDALASGTFRNVEKEFIPLADVPDLVWRTLKPADSSNHFADMDKDGDGEYAGKTLLQLCNDLENVSVKLWNAFYDSMGEDKRGALPFRVWQIYNKMVQYAKRKEINEFVCAAGVVSHYIADACISLHISQYHHGRDESEKPVHSEYENKMIERYAAEIFGGVNAAARPVSKTFRGGKKAAQTVVSLMQRTIKKLPPLEIVEAFANNTGRERLPEMYNALGERTIECLADGANCIATIWQSAWKEGGGGINAAVEVEHSVLSDIYRNRQFLPAYTLDDPRLAEELGVTVAAS